jgi:hypothetical protein
MEAVGQRVPLIEWAAAPVEEADGAPRTRSCPLPFVDFLTFWPIIFPDFPVSSEIDFALLKILTFCSNNTAVQQKSLSALLVWHN